MDSVTAITGSSSSSSGYGGSAITTPTTPLGSFECRSLSTPTPTTAATATTLTATAVPHTSLLQQHHHINIPASTMTNVAAVTPFYSEALNNMGMEMQQKQPITKQPQLQRQQTYYQPYATNYGAIHDTALNTRASHTMDYNGYNTTNLPFVERPPAINLRRHSVCLAPSAGVSDLEHNNIAPYNYASPGTSGMFTHNNNHNKLGNMVSTTKPQAAATPFYATPTSRAIMTGNTYFDANYKYKMSNAYNTPPYAQHSASYFQASKTGQYGLESRPNNYPAPALKPTPTRQSCNLFEKYDKYIPNSNLASLGRSSYNTSFDSEVYNRHKSAVSNTNSNWPCYMDYSSPANEATYLTHTNTTHDKLNKFDKYNTHSSYYPAPNVNNGPQGLWSNSHYMDRLVSAPYHQQMPPTPSAAPYHTNPYVQQSSRSNYCASVAPYPQQQTFYSPRHTSIPTPYDNVPNNGNMFMSSKYSDHSLSHHGLPHHALNKPKMSNDLHFGATSYEPNVHNYASTITPTQLPTPTDSSVLSTNNYYNEMQNFDNYGLFNSATTTTNNNQLPQIPINNNQHQIYANEATSVYMRTEYEKNNYNLNYYQQQPQQQPQQQQQQQQQQQFQQPMQSDYSQNGNCYLPPITNAEENSAVITSIANYVDQYDISGTRSTVYCNNNNNSNQSDNNIIDNQSNVTQSLTKNLSIRDFLTSWNDDEEEFGVGGEDFNFMNVDNKVNSTVVETVNNINAHFDNNANKMNNESEIISIKPPTNILAAPLITQLERNDNNNTLPIDLDTNQYMNLPDIVIDIEKSTTNMTTEVAATTSVEIKPDDNFGNFDVEKELDQLQTKQEKSVGIIKPTDAFTKCLERADFNANIEANLRKVAEKLTAHIEKRLNKRKRNSDEKPDQSPFENEYKTFIHKIDSSVILSTEKQDKPNEISNNISSQEDYNQYIKNFSKFYKRKRGISEHKDQSNCNTIKPQDNLIPSKGKEDSVKYFKNQQILRKAIKMRQNKFSHYYKTLRKLRKQNARTMENYSILKKRILTRDNKMKLNAEIYTPYKDPAESNQLEIENYDNPHEKRNEVILFEQNFMNKTESILQADNNSNDSMSSDSDSDSSDESTTSSSYSSSSSSMSEDNEFINTNDSKKTSDQAVSCNEHITSENQNLDDICSASLEGIKNGNEENCQIQNKLNSSDNRMTAITDKQTITNDIVALKELLQNDYTSLDKETLIAKTVNDTDKDLTVNLESEIMSSSDNCTILTSSDVEEECFGFESGEESETFQTEQNKRKKTMEYCQRLLKSPKSTLQIESNIPKLSDLCENMINLKTINVENVQTNCVLSVEEALAEMYRNVGVMSDIEDTQDDIATDSDEVLIINLQEILDGDSDLYVLQCDVNENILSVEEASTIADNTIESNLQTSDMELVQILNDSNFEGSKDDEKSFKQNMALDSGGRNSVQEEFVTTPIPSIHHEEIVPDNYMKYKKENFLKYLHSKYVQNNITKFYRAHRIIKKYKRRLTKILLKNY